jgi:hypothetical protein
MDKQRQGFQHVLSVSSLLADELPKHVFIGDIAIYLHAVNNPATRSTSEFSHDSDFMVSLADFSTLRDSQEVTSNLRLGKHQLVLEGVEFDVYVERHNNLIVPYDEVYAHSKLYGNMSVACVEHLLLLKLEAYGSRARSAKGDKDARDVVNLAIVCRGRVRSRLMAPFLRRSHVDSLIKISQGRVFTEMCRGNVHEARKLRERFEDMVQSIASLL